MKQIKIIIYFSIVFLISNCKKDDCVSEISETIKNDIHFKQIGCNPEQNGFNNFSMKFNSKAEYLANSCLPNNIPFPLEFEGIVLVKGVKVPYAGPNPGDQGYELSTSIKHNSCEKEIDLKFIITTIDTSNVFEHLESVIVALDGIDSTYKVNFSHEIIPYKE